MVYTYLAAWVSEHVDFTASIEACFQLDERLILVLKGGEKLCFVLSASDSFPISPKTGCFWMVLKA